MHVVDREYCQLTSSFLRANIQEYISPFLQQTQATGPGRSAYSSLTSLPNS